MILFSPMKFDEDTLSLYVRLFNSCFPTATKYSLAYLRWLYCANPAGLAVGFDAWDGDILAAHYVCIPVHVSINGIEAKALLSLNTATHPIYQGKGLFTQLAEKTYAAGAESGFDCVYGIANANSTPGFTRKLGFQFVEPLHAEVGIGSLNIDFEIVKRNTQFERVWSSECLEWRCMNPINFVQSRVAGNIIQFHARGFGHLLPAYAEINVLPPLWLAPASYRFLSPVRLFLGLIPVSASSAGQYISIPKKFRPSPLNLIYRSLSERVKTIEKGNVSLSFLDFDAY